MNRSNPNAKLREDAVAIWRAGLAAVQSDRLVRGQLRVEGDRLFIGDEALRLSQVRRIAVVGAGKAGAGMAAGVEEALGPQVLADKQVTGWVNVPADCVRPLTSIHLHAARPAGMNEPTADGVLGSEKILELVGSLGPDDLCLCLISGGGSALMPAPVPGVSLADKQAVTRELSAAGANIAELNTVRKQLSRIKGGALARACRAGRLVTLIISDVLGDPLDVIASGPTVADTTTASDALAVLERYGVNVPAVTTYLGSHHSPLTAHDSLAARQEPRPPAVTNLVIGKNGQAVFAAGQEAVRRGYSPMMSTATRLEGPADQIGVGLIRIMLHMATHDGPNCMIAGGEPTVRLAPPEDRGKGGRNQQLVLAALAALAELCNPQSAIRNPQFALLSGGTDGEDGPTDAAGAMIDGESLARLAGANLDPRDFLRRNDAYTFFEKLGGLVKTGPTHTNVCDVRVVLVDRSAP